MRFCTVYEDGIIPKNIIHGLHELICISYIIVCINYCVCNYSLETHRTVLNQILRQSQTPLSEGPFSVLVDHMKLLDFDVKNRYFKAELQKLDEGGCNISGGFGHIPVISSSAWALRIKFYLREFE